MQLRPHVGFQEEALSIMATIRGTNMKIRHLAMGVPVHFQYSNQDDPLLLLVCARDTHGVFGEPIAILEQARSQIRTIAYRPS